MQAQLGLSRRGARCVPVCHCQTKQTSALPAVCVAHAPCDGLAVHGCPQIQAQPIIGANGVVYIGSNDTVLYALDGASGDLLWSYATGNSIVATGAVGSNGVVYVVRAVTMPSRFFHLMLPVTYNLDG